MAIEWGLLSQGLDGPTPYEQQKSRNMQAQLQQQQLAGAQSQTRASEMQLQQMIESSNRTKKFAQDIAQRGGDPGDWFSVAEALNNTGQVENVIHAQKMVQDYYESDKLANILNNEPPPSFNKWIADKKASRANAAAPQPAAAPAAAPVAARVPDINMLATGGVMPVDAEPVNQLAIKATETPAAAANQGLTPVDVIDKPELTEKQKILALAQSNAPGAGRLLTAVSKTYDPSEVLKLENEIADFKKRGARDTDDVVKNRLQLIENMVSGKDPEYAGYQIAKREGFKGGFIDYKKLDANLKRVNPPSQPAVAVINPNTGKQQFVTREDAIKLGWEPASSAATPLTAAQEQKAKKERATDAGRFRAAKDTANELEKLTDELIGNPEKKIAPHPGLGGITGYSGVLPNLPAGAARDAQQKLETFKGKIMALGRSIQSAEGKLGNMAVQEWKFVSDAVEKLDPLASNFPDQLRDVVRQARDLQTKVEASFIDTYGENPVSGKPAGGNRAAGGKKPAGALPPGFVPDK